jgi:cobalt/nickel transport system ATP-binding protein
MKDVQYTYPDQTLALQRISLSIGKGEAIALIGGNGAGKSTLLSLLVGVFFPTAGSITIGEVELTPKSAALIRRKVGMVFQNPDDQLFMPTVSADVAFGPLNMGIAPVQAAQLAESALATVGAGGLAKRSSHRLSLGEKRAVAIASVLAMSPEVLLMDEPTSGLDPWSRRQLITLLNSFDHTRIIATHDLDFALDVCQRTLVMQNGGLVASGPTREIMRDKALLESCRLELPLRLQ